jgi:hypothetical protein
VDNVSELTDVELLVNLDATKDAADSARTGLALRGEAKRRGLLTVRPIAGHPDSPAGKLELTLRDVSLRDLNSICLHVTDSKHQSFMGLHGEALDEIGRRLATKARVGDKIYLSSGSVATICSPPESGAVFYRQGNNPDQITPIQNLEPSQTHGRGCWVINPRA